MKLSARTGFGFAMTALGCLVSSAARAGVVDSPLPAPFTQHVFTVPGVISALGVGTFFSCTNLDTAAVTVGVEIFFSGGGGPGNDASATSLSVVPGGTVMFGTSAAVGLSISSSLGAGGLTKGSARVLATSKKLACTAFVADTGNAPPTSSWQLNIVKKKTQKGD